MEVEDLQQSLRSISVPSLLALTLIIPSTPSLHHSSASISTPAMEMLPKERNSTNRTNPDSTRNDGEEKEKADRDGKTGLRILSQFYRLPQYPRFAISGLIGTVLFYLLYKLVFILNPIGWHHAAVSWTVSYLCSIIWQHSLHQTLVFQTTGGKSTSYLKELGLTYVSYSAGIVLSHFTMILLVDILYFDYQLAWLFTLSFTGLINYLFLSLTAFKKHD